MSARDKEAEKLRRDEEYRRFLEALGVRIRALRKQHGWSWRDMVVLHDFHLSKWQSYESGRYGISLPSLLRISKLFGLTVSQLLTDLETDSVAPKEMGTEEPVPEPPSKSQRRRPKPKA